MDERRSKYVLSDSNMLRSGLSAIALWADEDPTDYVRRTEDAYEHTEKFLRTLLARGHLFDCQGMSHLRLIYESEPVDGSVLPASQVKIFERVSGASIAGNSTADEGQVRAIGPYLVSSSNESKPVEVSEEEVLHGGEIAIDF